MAKNLITLGIGAAPGSLTYLLTGGLEIGEAVEVVRLRAAVSDARRYGSAVSSAGRYGATAAHTARYGATVEDDNGS